LLRGPSWDAKNAGQKEEGEKQNPGKERRPGALREGRTFEITE